MEHSKKIRLALCGTVTLIVVATATIHQYLVDRNDIPLPFFSEQNSSLTGDLTRIGRKKYDFFRVTFPAGVNSETLVPDTIYLVSVPNDASIETVMLDQAVTANGSHDVNYFGYKYVSADSATEKAHKQDPLLKDKFPGTFFASAKARAADAAHGNALANFETAHSIVMAATGTEDGVLLTANSLYFLILNETGTLTVRVPEQIIDTTNGNSENMAVTNAPAQSVCGNGIQETGEQCDDLNKENNDGCSEACMIIPGFHCTGTPSTCSAIPVCNNGIVESPETCDNGQSNTNDCIPDEGASCSFCSADTCTTVTKQG